MRYRYLKEAAIELTIPKVDKCLCLQPFCDPEFCVKIFYYSIVSASWGPLCCFRLERLIKFDDFDQRSQRMAESPAVLGMKVLYEGPKPCVEYVTTPEILFVESCTDFFLLIILSIVAAHGLGASPDWAWIRKVKNGDKEVKVNWLADENMLPTKLPNSRIMTFNYESKWLLGAPKQRCSLCAIQLLTALDHQRKEVKTCSPYVLPSKF